MPWNEGDKFGILKIALFFINLYYTALYVRIVQPWEMSLNVLKINGICGSLCMLMTQIFDDDDHDQWGNIVWKWKTSWKHQCMKVSCSLLLTCVKTWHKKDGCVPIMKIMSWTQVHELSQSNALKCSQPAGVRKLFHIEGWPFIN